MLFFSGGCWFPADLIFPLGKATVVLFYNAFHFSESHHKNLYIGITVRFECIGDFIQPVGNLRFGFFDSYLQRFSFFTFEKPFVSASCCFNCGRTLSCKFLIFTALSCTFIIRFLIWRNSAISISSVGLGWENAGILNGIGLWKVESLDGTDYREQTYKFGQSI